MWFISISAIHNIHIWAGIKLQSQKKLVIKTKLHFQNIILVCFINLNCPACPKPVQILKLTRQIIDNDFAQYMSLGKKGRKPLIMAWLLLRHLNEKTNKITADAKYYEWANIYKIVSNFQVMRIKTLKKNKIFINNSMIARFKILPKHNFDRPPQTKVENHNLQLTIRKNKLISVRE